MRKLGERTLRRGSPSCGAVRAAVIPPGGAAPPLSPAAPWLAGDPPM